MRFVQGQLPYILPFQRLGLRGGVLDDPDYVLLNSMCVLDFIGSSISIVHYVALNVGCKMICIGIVLAW